MELTRDQLIEMLKHDEDTDIWVLNEDGTTSVLPDQDITALQNPNSWPRYICRSSSINEHVEVKGEDGALDFVNMIIGLTMGTATGRASSSASRAGLSLGRMFSRKMGV